MGVATKDNLLMFGGIFLFSWLSYSGTGCLRVGFGAFALASFAHCFFDGFFHWRKGFEGVLFCSACLFWGSVTYSLTHWG